MLSVFFKINYNMLDIFKSLAIHFLFFKNSCYFLYKRVIDLMKKFLIYLFLDKKSERFSCGTKKRRTISKWNRVNFVQRCVFVIQNRNSDKTHTQRYNSLATVNVR